MNNEQPLLQIASGPLTAHALRLSPGQDLVPALQEAAAAACRQSSSTAAFIMTAVGSLSSVTLRMASACADSGGSSSGVTPTNPVRTWTAPVEVTSFVGTMAVSSGGSVAKHWHMTISDAKGDSFGGHVMAGTVRTTMEIVLGTIGNGVSFAREMDAATGYQELVVRQAGEAREEETSKDGLPTKKEKENTKKKHSRSDDDSNSGDDSESLDGQSKNPAKKAKLDSPSTGTTSATS
jgi:predicted DNA-binding protein with PD1-like motif